MSYKMTWVTIFLKGKSSENVLGKRIVIQSLDLKGSFLSLQKENFYLHSVCCFLSCT